MQKAMLEAKAAGLPLPTAEGAAPPEPPMDPAITIAIAKAKAAALATCNSGGGGAEAVPTSMTAQDAIAKANATLAASSTAVGETTGLLNTMQMMTGQPRPPMPGALAPGLAGGLPGQTMLRPTISPMGQMGSPQVILPKAQMGMMGGLGGGLRPTIRPPGVVLPGIGGAPQVVPPPSKMQAVSPMAMGMTAMSKSAGGGGVPPPPPGGAMPKQAGPDLGSVAGMKEISPALAALMSGSG